MKVFTNEKYTTTLLLSKHVESYYMLMNSLMS